MEAIVLLYRDEALRSFELGPQPLEVGSGAGCDVVVHDSEVAERQLLVRRDAGEVVAYDLREGTPRRPFVLRPGVPYALSRRSAIVRIPDAPTRPHALGRTDPIPLRDDERETLSLLIGRGTEARRVQIGKRPITLGTAESCDVVLHDRCVSARHCRFEPSDDGVIVRDLASRNGTWVDGVRAFVARIGPGARIRIGRTDLTVVAPGASGDARCEGLVARSPAMLKVLGLVERYARLPYAVLIVGESGSGKEGIARALHLRGPRRDRPFVTVNAGGLPRDLIESELFGHERGAFTGAMAMRRGVFEQADGGTLFLDEIGELAPELQARLLRVLETGEVRRVGGERAFRVDVRVVCATHRDLHAMTADGSFRKDLFYRIAQLPIHVPPLREREEDVRALAEHFLAQASGPCGPRTLTEPALARLLAHDWPGNVRELRNVVLSAAANSAGAIDVDDIDAAIRWISGSRAVVRPASMSLADVVVRHGGNLSAAARALGIPRTTLRDRLRAESRSAAFER
jgi:transcriptional regulator with AAA-type ATPase domain